jgi:hypothetical protein
MIRPAGISSSEPKKNTCFVCHFKKTKNKEAVARELDYYHYEIPFPDRKTPVPIVSGGKMFFVGGNQ